LILKAEALWRGGAGIDLEVIALACMDAIELPPGNADHPVLAPAFPFLDDPKRREDPDKDNIEPGEEDSIVLHLGFQHDVIDNEIVALGR
jgi:hypothetical protein